MVLLLVLAFQLDGFGILARDMKLILAGDLASLRGSSPIEDMMAVIFAVMLLQMPCSALAGVIQQLVLGPLKGNEIAERFREDSVGSLRQLLDKLIGAKDPTSLFRSFFLVAFIEEMTRWLTLELFGFKLMDGNNIVLFSMFIIGNTAWSLWHLTNFAHKDDRHPFRVFPHFVSGVFYSYVFLKFGLVAALLAHFGANALLFATSKNQKTDIKDLWITLGATITAVLAFCLIDRPIFDALVWLNENPNRRLPGWNFFDYAFFCVFVSAFLSAVFGALLYARVDTKNDLSNHDHSIECKVSCYVRNHLPHVLLRQTIIVLSVFLLFWPLGLIIPNIALRVIVIAIGFNFLRRGSSPSAVARIFWTGIPSLFVMANCCVAVGFLQSIPMMILVGLFLSPLRFLRRHDD